MAKKKIKRPYYCKVCKKLTESDDRSRDTCYDPDCEEQWESKARIRRRFSSAAYNSGSISGASIVG